MKLDKEGRLADWGKGGVGGSGGDDGRPADADHGPGGLFPSWGWLYGVVVVYGVAAILLLAFVTWLAERWVS